MNEEFQQFPVEKRRIRYEDPPELIFFDVDEDSEEAELISVDDLFRLSEAEDSPRCFPVRFTLFPAQKGDYIDSRLSRVIHRTLLMACLQMEKTPRLVRLRPTFVQWQLDPDSEAETESIARELRGALELQLHSLKNLDEKARFWASVCLIHPADAEITDDALNALILQYQSGDQRGANE